MKVSTPFISRVPKTLRENLLYRKQTLQCVLTEPEYAELVVAACAKDPLFFINTFAWTYSPKDCPERPIIPFILYPFQEQAMLDILDAIGNHDLLIEKSRDMGASYLNIYAMGWCWRFVPGFSGLFVSRVENYVDQAGNPKCLFWKLDFLLQNLPNWLIPKGYDDSCRKQMHIENPETGGVIDGEATTGNVARGDRRTAILLDEFAAVPDGHRVLTSTRDATNCRLFNSTPSGVNSAFYDVRQLGIKRLRLHWSQHPVKNIGLYTCDERGKLKVIISDGYPKDYEPILDGKLRSPCYDNECKRAASAQEIAQELDIDYLGSGFQYFNPAAIIEQIRKHARSPELIGELEYDDLTGDPIRFVEGLGGSLKLWCTLDGEGTPPRDHKYSMGVDVSAGTGASNSCLAGYDRTTNTKVWEYANSHVRPEAFGKQAVAIAKWFGGAYIVWESGGPGRQFGSKIMELGYGNIHYRRRSEGLSGSVTDIPGVVTTKEIKLLLLGDYRAAVERGACINLSKDAMEETLEYIYSGDGGIEHSRSTNKVDPSGAKANHGDRVIADALAWLGMRDQSLSQLQEKPEVPIGCLKWRQQLRERQQKEIQDREDGWAP
jgi:hypothetical protein